MEKSGLSKEILVILTGGTICSLPEGEMGKNQSNAKKRGFILRKISEKAPRHTAIRPFFPIAASLPIFLARI